MVDAATLFDIDDAPEPAAPRTATRVIPDREAAFQARSSVSRAAAPAIDVSKMNDWFERASLRKPERLDQKSELARAFAKGIDPSAPHEPEFSGKQDLRLGA